jgi:hypothetical protein
VEIDNLHRRGLSHKAYLVTRELVAWGLDGRPGSLPSAAELSANCGVAESRVGELLVQARNSETKRALEREVSSLDEDWAECVKYLLNTYNGPELDIAGELAFGFVVNGKVPKIDEVVRVTGLKRSTVGDHHRALKVQVQELFGAEP